MTEQTDPGTFIPHSGEYFVDDQKFLMKDFLLSQGISPSEHIEGNYEPIKRELIEKSEELGFEFYKETDTVEAMIFTRMPKKYSEINSNFPVDTHGLLIKHKDSRKKELNYYLIVGIGSDHYYINAHLGGAEIVKQKGESISFPQGYSPFGELVQGTRGVKPLSDCMFGVIEKSVEAIKDAQG